MKFGAFLMPSRLPDPNNWRIIRDVYVAPADAERGVGVAS